MRKITLYTKPNCPLCDQTRYQLDRLLPQYGGAVTWDLSEVSIIEDSDLYRQFRFVIPVVDVEGIGPLPAPASLDPVMLRRLLGSKPEDASSLGSTAAVLLQAGQFEAETSSMSNAIESGAAVPTAEAEQRHELYEQLVNTIDAPLEAVTANVQALEETRRAQMDAQHPVVAQQDTQRETMPEPIDFAPGTTPPAPQLPFPPRYPDQYYTPQPPEYRGPLGFLDKFAASFSKRWVGIVNTITGTFSILPWLAPVFAKLGWWPIADAIYTFYMFFCHQLPERAGNLFGYQVAYCYRNSAIYGSVFLAGLLFGYARTHPGRFSWILKPLPWQLFLLALVPIGVDGLSHMFGLRENNAWFDALTGGVFGNFSVGDSLGTLNWWLRVISGTLMGFCAIWLIFPWVDRAIRESNNPYNRPSYPPVRPSAVAEANA